MKSTRLRTSADFRRVYAEGVKRASPSFVLFARGNGLQLSRFGVTTPRKLGKAHERNRIKRRVREIIRLSQPMLPKGFDFVINPRRSASRRDFTELRRELLQLVRNEE